MTTKRVKISKDDGINGEGYYLSWPNCGLWLSKENFELLRAELLPDPVPPGDCVAGCERNKHFCGRYPDPVEAEIPKNPCGHAKEACFCAYKIADPVAEGEDDWHSRDCLHALHTNCDYARCKCFCHTPKEEKCDGTCKLSLKDRTHFHADFVAPIEAMECEEIPDLPSIHGQSDTDRIVILAAQSNLLWRKLNEVIRALNRLTRK